MIFTKTFTKRFVDRNDKFPGILGNSFFPRQQELGHTALLNCLRDLNKNGPRSDFGGVDQSCAMAASTSSIFNRISIEIRISRPHRIVVSNVNPDHSYAYALALNATKEFSFDFGTDKKHKC